MAAKLRLLQQKTGLALLDVWNVIEAFRENGLNHVEPDLSIPRAKLEALLASMYGALAKRLPPPTGKQYAFKRWDRFMAILKYLLVFCSLKAI